MPAASSVEFGAQAINTAPASSVSPVLPSILGVALIALAAFSALYSGLLQGALSTMSALVVFPLAVITSHPYLSLVVVVAGLSYYSMDRGLPLNTN